MLLMFFLIEKQNHVKIDPIDLVGSKTIWITSKNIVWLKINIHDEIFFINIETKIYWINSDQPGITCQSICQVMRP
jgi:hypothetical protein